MKRPQRRKASESKALIREAVVGGVLSTCSVPITNNPDSPIGVPQVLFTGRYLSTDLPQFDLTSDGQRFVMVKPIEDELDARTIRIVDGRCDELQRRVPTK